MYIKKCSYPDAAVYMDCLKKYQVPFEWKIDKENPNNHYIFVKVVEPENVHSVCYTFLPTKDIGWDEYASDLYVRITEESKKIMAVLKPNALLTTFRHNIENDVWYDLPFCKDARLGTGVSLVGYAGIERGKQNV